MEKRRKKIRVYLDTSDYNHLFSGKVDKHNEVREYLIDKVEAGEIVVPLSYPVMMELFQEYNATYWDEMIEKASFVKKICKNKAFKFPMDIRDGVDPYSEKLDWHANFEKEKLDIDNIAHVFVAYCRMNGLLLYQGGRISLSSYALFLDFLYCNSRCVDTHLVKFDLPDEFFVQDVLGKYISGKMSKEEANDLLREMINDPVLFCKNFYMHFNGDNYFSKPFHGLSRIMHKPIKIVHSLRDRGEEVDPIIDNLDVKEFGPVFCSLFPSYLGDVLNAYVKDHCQNKQKLQRSDMADLMHALYLPYSDLWRGDSKFSNVLIRQKVKYKEKIVQKLKDLPNRIDLALRVN